MTDNKSLYSYGRFDVVIIDNHREDGVDVPGYGVVNRETGITESSTTLLFHAIQTCHNCEDFLKEVQNKQDNGDDWKLAIPAKTN